MIEVVISVPCNSSCIAKCDVEAVLAFKRLTINFVIPLSCGNRLKMVDVECGQSL